MKPSIEVILFDVGGTLRMPQNERIRNFDLIRSLQVIANDRTPPEVFVTLLKTREEEYRRWARKTYIELGESDLWTRYLLPELPEAACRQNAQHMNQLWRDSSERRLLPDAIHTIKTLSERGYKLGIISNTTSSVEVPRLLEENNIANLFSVVILSCVFGRRKPHPSLFLAAARAAEVTPQNCAYLGDKTARDLIGARQAGYGMAGLINPSGYSLDGFDPDDERWTDTITEIKPDFKIGRLSELLGLFPPRKQFTSLKYRAKDKPECYYDAALSTMWGVGQDVPFSKTFSLGRQAGFVKFELNHQVTPELYALWDPNRFYIASVHDPCPAEFSDSQLKKADLLVSSLEGSRRKQGVDRAKRTIDLARRLGARLVVLHPGSIAADTSRDRYLRDLYQKGMRETDAYRDLVAELIKHRASLANPYVDQVVKSLTEIIEFARGADITIGLENRYRYYDIPLPDEMERLLRLCSEDWFGFQYDVGHAQALDALGLVPHLEWLERFSPRMVGTHLHDVIGTTDHQVPGNGEVNFKKIAAHLPATAIRTLEVGPRASLSELSRGLKFLADNGCIQRL